MLFFFFQTISLASVESTVVQTLLPRGQIKSVKCIRLNKLGYRFRKFVELQEMFTWRSLTLMTHEHFNKINCLPWNYGINYL